MLAWPAARVARCVAAGLTLTASAPTGADGQSRGTAGPPPACAPVAASRGPTITFGHRGGSLRPRTVSIGADGVVRAGADSATDSVTVIDALGVAALARLARTGGFWSLRPAPVTRPPRNPDAARAFIAVRLTCGSHRAEYVMGERTPAAFRELDALLAQVTKPPAGQ